MGKESVAYYHVSSSLLFPNLLKLPQLGLGHIAASPEHSQKSKGLWGLQQRGCAVGLWEHQQGSEVEDLWELQQGS